MPHIPVLLEEIIDFLKIDSGKVFIDATADGGGHITAILKDLAVDGVLIGIDQDADMVRSLEDKFGEDKRTIFVCENFRNIQDIVGKYKEKVDGILFDLGFSSLQLEESGRGFSFQKNEPLLMTYKLHPEPEDLTAAKIVNTWKEEDLKKIIREYGEERFAGRIARHIVEKRKHSRILTTFELVDIISSAVPGIYKRSRIHPATRTFQALRIAVNDELGALEEGLEGGWNVLKKGGRMLVISFHSLEDRIVKNFFRSKKQEGIANVLTKKPIVPGKAESASNPRTRSAKLRVAEKRQNNKYI